MHEFCSCQKSFVSVTQGHKAQIGLAEISYKYLFRGFCVNALPLIYLSLGCFVVGFSVEHMAVICLDRTQIFCFIIVISRRNVCNTFLKCHFI